MYIETNELINLHYATIKFRVKFETNFGQELRVAGNIEELGSWDLRKSLVMETNQDIYPYWRSKQSITGPVGMRIDYKYVIYDSNTSQYIWESNDITNRIFIINFPGTFELNDEQGNKKCEVKKISPTSDEDNAEFLSDGENTKATFFLREEITELLTYDPIKLASNAMSKKTLMNHNLKITKDDRLIIVTPFLPFNVVKQNGCYNIKVNDYNLIYSLMFEIKQRNIIEVIWIGMLKDYLNYDKREFIRISEILIESNIYLVTLSENDFINYNIYVNKILKKVFTTNTIDENNDYFLNYEEYFNSFQKANNEFSKIILKIMHNTDLILINDIDLMLIPIYLIPKNNNAKVGIYFHSPFPSSDVFKVFPNQKNFLKSILLCDIIGFHVFQYARHFLNSVKRILGIFYEVKMNGMITLSYLGRNIILRVEHAGHDVKIIRNTLSKSNYKDLYESLKNKYSKKYNYISIDSINENVSNMIIKFKAFSKFAQKNKLTNVRLIQVLKEDDDEYNNIEINKENNIAKITKVINDINSLFNSQEPLIVIDKYNNISSYLRYALFSIADCILDLRHPQGSCIYSLEYILIQNEIKEKKYGLIISEDIGISNAIKGCLLVNTFDIISITKGLENIYYLPETQRTLLFKKDVEYALNNTTINWMENYFIDLKQISENDNCTKIPISMGLNFQLMKLNKNFIPLSKDLIAKAYKKSTRALIFLDYEGTLQSIKNDIEEFDSPNQLMPSPSLLSLLSTLTENKKNIVYIISEREREFMFEWFGSIPSLGIAAENGFFYREPYSNLPKNKFSHSTIIADWSWKESVIKILQGFTEKTEGSYITQKETMISWKYSQIEGYFGHLQVNEIKTHLNNILGGTSVMVTHGKGSINIQPKNVNKGYFVSHILQEKFLSEEEPDLIIAIGDEPSDEEMFKYLNYIEDKFSLIKGEMQIINCIIGNKNPSQAKYYLNNPSEVIELLDIINQVSNSSCFDSDEINQPNMEYYHSYCSDKKDELDIYSEEVESIEFNC